MTPTLTEIARSLNKYQYGPPAQAAMERGDRESARAAIDLAFDDMGMGRDSDSFPLYLDARDNPVNSARMYTEMYGEAESQATIGDFFSYWSAPGRFNLGDHFNDAQRRVITAKLQPYFEMTTTQLEEIVQASQSQMDRMLQVPTNSYASARDLNGRLAAQSEAYQIVKKLTKMNQFGLNDVLGQKVKGDYMTSLRDEVLSLVKAQ